MLIVCVVADTPDRRLDMPTAETTWPLWQQPMRLHFTAAQSQPLPGPPDLADGPALKPHEVFGFAPYWTLPNEAAYPLGALTTIAYFGIDVSADGGLVRKGNGWNGYESQQFVDLVTRAHRQGARVVLTAKSFDDATLHSLASSPAAGSRLATELAVATRAKNLDGVNLDFEGRSSADREAIAHLINALAASLHVEGNHWQVSVDTYSASAADQNGFFDVKAIAPAVDAFFVMAYDMALRSGPSANAPLSGPGWNDSDAVESYVAVVPADKIVLGIPLYGYDWPVADDSSGAQATGPPMPISYAEIAQHRLREFWDAATQTPWTRYQAADGGWHQIRYDDPTSIALKTQLAANRGLRGVGVWALGMDGNRLAVRDALLGGAALLKYAVELGSPPPDRLGSPKSGGKITSLPSRGPSLGPSQIVGQVDGLTAATTSYNQIRLSWQPVAGGVGDIHYQVFASKQAGFQPASGDLVGETKVTSFTHTGLGLREDWHYLVRAMDAHGDVGPTSAEVSARSGNAFLIEAESLVPSSGAPGDLSRQPNCCGVAWSAGQQLLFSATRTGEWAMLGLPSLPPGKYELSVEPTLGPNNGVLAMEIGDQTSLTTVDEYAKALQVSPQAIDLGQVELSGNVDGLELTVPTKNALSTGYQLGIDYLVLRPAESQ